MPEFDPFQPIDKTEFEVDDFPSDIDDVDVDPNEMGMEGEPDVNDVTDDMITSDDIDIDDDEIDPVGDFNLSGISKKEAQSNKPDLDLGPEIDTTEEVDDIPIAPEVMVKWTPVSTDNGEIISKHIDGYVLRAKPLSAKSGSKNKYIVQLHKGKIIEKGIIWVDNNRDAREFLQNVSDRILDRTGLVNKSEEAVELEGGELPESGELPDGELEDELPEGELPESDEEEILSNL